MLAIGCCALGVMIVPRVGADHAARRQLAADVARIGLIAGIVLIPASLVRLVDQLLALRSPGDPMFAGLQPLMLSTTWGRGFLSQMSALVVTLAGFVLVRRTRAPAWWIASAGALGLGATLSLQGHAIGNEDATLIAVFADVSHVTAAGLWIGTISVIGVLGTSLRAAEGTVASASADAATARLRVLVPLVPPVALTGAALLVVSGVVSSLLQLRAADELWTTAWGRFVGLKAMLLLAIAALGARNWRQLGRRLETATGVRALRRTLLIELALAALVVLITALLVVTPLPGE